MITGIFHLQGTVSFPAILIKSLGGDQVLIYVFTDAGPQMREATDGSGDDPNTFVRD